MTTSNKIAPNPTANYIFKCERHAATSTTTAFEQFPSCFQKEELFDTILIAGNDRLEIQAHKVVLSSLSEYLLEIFRNNPKVSNANYVVELKEIEHTTLKSIIDFMYSGWIELSSETAENFLRAATFLKIKTLIEGCNDFIGKQLTLSNCLYWYLLANELALPGLKETSSTFAYAHFELVSKEKELLLLNEVDIKNILFNDNPHGDFEEDVFRSLVAWIAYDKVNREHLLFQILSMVRYQYLTPKFILKNRKSVCKTAETCELICSWLELLLPETPSVDEQNCDLEQRKANQHKIGVIYPANDNQDKVGIQTYDSKVDSWCLVKEIALPYQKINYGMIVVDEKLIVIGGVLDGELTNRVECFDLHTCLWTDMPPMNRAQISWQVTSSKGYLCVLDDETMQIYNFSTCIWNEVQYPSEPSGFHKIVFHNGIVHNLDFHNGRLQSYDVASNQWTSKAIMEKRLRMFGVEAVDKCLYVIGGCLDVTGKVTSVMRYDLSNDTWCSVAPLNTPNYFSMENLVLEDKIFLLPDDDELFEEYNTDTNKWTTHACPNFCEFGYNCCVFSSKLL